MQVNLIKAYEKLADAARNVLELSEHEDHVGQYVMDEGNYEDLAEAYAEIHRLKTEAQGPPATKAEHNWRMMSC